MKRSIEDAEENLGPNLKRKEPTYDVVKARKELKRLFSKDVFRPGQIQVIEALHDGKNACAIFPTGGGKSLCYQFPALTMPASEGMTVVVSPLIALMKDQVDALKADGHAADVLNSTLTHKEKREVQRRVSSGECRILYLAPEQLNNEYSRGLIQSVPNGIALMAIDEAHCVAEWGHAFRPDYLRLAKFAKTSGAKRVLALTATATKKVSEELQAAFNIHDKDVVRTSFHRSNLVLGMQKVEVGNRDAALVRRLRDSKVAPMKEGPTIVYVTTQGTTEEVADMLSKKGFNALPYHAGMKAEVKAANQDRFMSTQDTIIVATIAFGMGIDKANIRHVIHYNIPKSLEGYAQEIGRAGRDGETSWCTTLLCAADVPLLQSFSRADGLDKSTCKDIIEHILLQDGAPAPLGTVKEVMLSRLRKTFDVSETSLGMMLAFMDIYSGHLENLTPNYAQTKVRPRAEEKGGAAKAWGLLQSHLSPGLWASASAVAKKGRDWVTLEMNLLEDQGVRASLASSLTQLESEGHLKTQGSLLQTRYRILSHPTSINALVDTEYQRFKVREDRELARIDQVVNYLCASSCQQALLCAHFGEDISSRLDSEGSCGAACEYCRGGRLPITPPPSAAWAPSSAMVQQLRTLLRAPGFFPADVRGQTIMRFCFGTSSPALSAQHKSHPLHGAFQGCDYEALQRQLSL